MSLAYDSRGQADFLIDPNVKSDTCLVRLDLPKPKRSTIPPFASIDYETYYDNNYSLSKMSVFQYVDHPSFNAYLVGIVIWNGAEWLGWSGKPEDFDWKILTGYQLIAHNAGFDAVVQAKLVEQGKIPAFDHGGFFCTMDLVVYLQLCPGSLADSVKGYYGEVVDKSTRAKMKGGIAGLSETEIKEYALTDAVWCARLWGDLESFYPESEKKLSKLTRDMNFRGFTLDVDQCDEFLRTIDEESDDLRHQIPWRGSYADTSDVAFSHFVRMRGLPAPPSLGKADEEFLGWRADLERIGSADARKVLTVLDCIKALGKLNQMKAWLLLVRGSRRPSVENRVPIQFRYCKAIHTRRWQTEGSIRMQNLDKSPFYGIDLRKCIVPRKGHVFLIADYSQIEPRVLNWLAGDTKFLELCAGGVSPYEAHARATMGYTDPRLLKDAMPTTYALAKIRVLSLGYQAAALALVHQANGMGIPIKLDREYTLADGTILPAAEEVVSEFRRDSKLITALWERYENDLRRSIGGEWALPLPCGSIRYFNVRTTDRRVGRNLEVIADILKYPKRPEHTKSLYGGKLTENAVQCFSRYLLGEAIVRTSDIATQVFHVHDEIVFDIPDDESLIVEIVRRMEQTPTWARGLPLKVSYEKTSHYTK